MSVTIFSCTKDYYNYPDQNQNVPPTKKYGTVQEFFSASAPKPATFSMTASTGGSFTTTQGTIVTVPSNAFMTLDGITVTGNIDLQFLDILKPSDMVLAQKPTVLFDGTPLKSGGEYFIKATQNGEVLQIVPGSYVQVVLPLQGLPYDNGMQMFAGSGNPFVWNPTTAANITFDSVILSYNILMTALENPDSGTYYNCDNPNVFPTYPKTTLTLIPIAGISEYASDADFIYSAENTVVHVYKDVNNNFSSQYAPVGLECTALMIGMVDSALYAAFVPVTITDNLTANFEIKEISYDDFLAQLKDLDN